MVCCMTCSIPRFHAGASCAPRRLPQRSSRVRTRAASVFPDRNNASKNPLNCLSVIGTMLSCILTSFRVYQTPIRNFSALFDSIRYSLNDVKMQLNIVPMTLRQFKGFFEALFRSGKTDAARVRTLLDRCGSLRGAHEAPAWKRGIEQVIQQTIQSILMN